MKRQRVTRRDFVVEHLHWDGRYAGQLSPEEYEQAYRLGDGFGPTDDMPHEAFGDWSHIRDSSDEAIADIFLYLVSTLQYDDVEELVSDLPS